MQLIGLQAHGARAGACGCVPLASRGSTGTPRAPACTAGLSQWMASLYATRTYTYTHNHTRACAAPLYTCAHTEAAPRQSGACCSTACGCWKRSTRENSSAAATLTPPAALLPKQVTSGRTRAHRATPRCTPVPWSPPCCQRAHTSVLRPTHQSCAAATPSCFSVTAAAAARARPLNSGGGLVPLQHGRRAAAALKAGARRWAGRVRQRIACRRRCCCCPGAAGGCGQLVHWVQRQLRGRAHAHAAAVVG